jgi:hypothetical protein
MVPTVLLSAFSNVVLVSELRFDVKHPETVQQTTLNCALDIQILS